MKNTWAKSIVPVLLAIVLAWLQVVGVTHAQQLAPDEDALRQATETLLTGQLNLTSVPHQFEYQQTRWAETAAYIEVSVRYETEWGEESDVFRVYTLLEEGKIVAIFREPSDEFFQYAESIPPELLPRERLSKWLAIKEHEENQILVSGALYRLPFTGTETYTISRGGTAHDYAYDFLMNEGTLVRATRGGQVSKVREDQTSHCAPGGSCIANLVRITHTDNTFGFYIHLQYGGAIVNEGDYVDQGDCIAYSGFTGQASTPHLHFNEHSDVWNQPPYNPITWVEAPPENPRLSGSDFASPPSLNSTEACEGPDPDTTPPTRPTNLHWSCGTWYESGSSRFTRTRKPCFSWSNAEDPESGIAGYYAAVDQNKPVRPEYWVGTNTSLNIHEALGEGSHFLAVTAENGEGLRSFSSHYGFGVDTNSPTLPTYIHAGCTDKNNLWQNTCNDPAFAWFGASDNGGSGVKDYHVWWGAEPGFRQVETSFNPPELTPPGSCATQSLRLAVRDNLLQESVAGSAFVLRYDDIPPADTNLVIDGGANATNQVTVRLDISAYEPEHCSGVDEMRLSNNQITWTDWLPYEETTLWTIPALNRRWLTVYVQVRDEAENESEVAQDSILLDLYPEKPHSHNYRICADIFDAGGQSKESSSYWMFGAIGQPIAGSGLEGLTHQGADGLLGTMDGCPLTWVFTTGYTLTHQVMATSGGLRGSDTYRLADTSGQFVASGDPSAASPNYQVWSGFWPNITGSVPEAPQYTPPPTPPPTPEPSPPEPTVTEDKIFGVQAGELGLDFVNQITTTLRLWAPAVEEVQISKEPEFVTATWQTVVPTLTWYYAPDPELITGTRIFARFRDEGGTVYGDYETTVFYDSVPPEGRAEILDIYEGVTTVGLDATDDNSGVYDMRLALEPEFIGAEWQIYTDTLTTTLPVENLLYAQFRDRAGNLSQVVSTVQGNRLYLPLVLKEL